MHACMELHYEVLTSAGNNQPSLQHPHSLDSHSIDAQNICISMPKIIQFVVMKLGLKLKAQN